MLDRFGERAVSAQGVAVRLAGGADTLADVVRALDAEGIRIADVAFHAPRSTTCSWRRRAARSRSRPAGTAAEDVARSQILAGAGPEARETRPDSSSAARSCARCVSRR